MNTSTTRKHYRVYAKKHTPDSSESCITLKSNKMMFGLVGLAFVKGLFWGYVLKGKCRRR